MAYNEHLASRAREILLSQRKVEEKKMMGGLAFMVNGKMCVGILKDDLMARIDPEAYASALGKRGCREMDFTGRPMKGFLFVSDEGLPTEKALRAWLKLGIEFGATAKKTSKNKRKR